MKEQDKFEAYFYTKFLLSILFNDEIYLNIKEGTYNHYIFNSMFLSVLINKCEDLSNFGILDNSMKKKLYDLIFYIRNNITYNSLELKKYFNDKFNELIILLNTSKELDDEEFYISELIKRYSYNKLIKMSFAKYYQKKEIIKKSIGYDFILLLFHSDETDDHMFNEVLEDFAMDEYYFLSLNVILFEYPELLHNKTFKERVEKVIELNKKSKRLLSKKTLAEKIFILKNNFKYKKIT